MRAALIILSLLAVLATACGSDDTGSAELTDDTAIASAEVDGDADATVEVDGDATAVTTDVAGLGERCTEITEAFTAIPAALGSAATGTADADAIRAQADAFAEVAADVPAEYAGDFQLYADYFANIAVAVESGDPAELATVASTGSSADFTAASSNLATFFANGCQ